MEILTKSQLIEAHEAYNAAFPDMFRDAALSDLSFVEEPWIRTIQDVEFLRVPPSIVEPNGIQEIIECQDLLGILFALAHFHPIDCEFGAIIWRRRDTSAESVDGWSRASVFEEVFMQMSTSLAEHAKRDARTLDAITVILRKRLKAYFSNILNEWTNQVVDHYPESEKAAVRDAIPKSEYQIAKRKSKRPQIGGGPRLGNSGTGITV